MCVYFCGGGGEKEMYSIMLVLQQKACLHAFAICIIVRTKLFQNREVFFGLGTLPEVPKPKTIPTVELGLEAKGVLL